MLDLKDKYRIIFLLEQYQESVPKLAYMSE